MNIGLYRSEISFCYDSPDTIPELKRPELSPVRGEVSCPKMLACDRKSQISRGNFENLSLVEVLSPFLLMLTVAFAIHRIILDLVYNGSVADLK